MNMGGLLCLDHARKTGTGGWLNWAAPEKLVKGWRGVDA